MTTHSDSETSTSSCPKPKSAFVISPIGVQGSDAFRKATYALKYIFRAALTGDGWEVHRADEGRNPDSIGQHVIKKLYDADLVIADLTGHNPNVFYELAIAHGLRKPVVHLISKGETIPFDIFDLRTIFYDITDLASVEEAVAMLREYAKNAVANAEELITPLSSFEAFSQIRNDQDLGGGAVAEILEQVLTRLARMESKMSSGMQNSTPSRAVEPKNSSADAHEGSAGTSFSQYLSLSKVLDSLSGTDGTFRPNRE